MIPLVSVIITTYNRPDFLSQAIKSVLSQTFTDFEVVIIDDGSTDNTRSVVECLHEHRIRYVYQENSGLSAARNTGIRSAQGKYIAFLDDDDLWLPIKLDCQMRELESNPQIGFVSSGYQIIDYQGNLLDKVRPWIWRPELNLQTWLYGCPTIPSTVMVSRRWLENVGGFDISFSNLRIGSEDWDLWLRLAYAGCQMEWASEIVCLYRIHQSSMVHNAQRQQEGMLLTLDRFYSQLDLPIDLVDQKCLVYSSAYLRGAMRLYAAGNIKDAEADVERAIELEPGLVVGDGQALFNFLAEWFVNPLIEDPAEYVSSIFDHLPDAASMLKKRKSEALGMTAKRIYFEAYQKKDWWTVRYSLGRMIRYHPSLLFDRGIFSVIIKMLILYRS